MGEEKKFEKVEKIIRNTLKQELKKVREIRESLKELFKKEFGYEPDYIDLRNAVREPKFELSREIEPDMELLFELAPITKCGKFTKKRVELIMKNSESEDFDWMLNYVDYYTLELAKVSSGVKYIIVIK